MENKAVRNHNRDNKKQSGSKNSRKLNRIAGWVMSRKIRREEWPKSCMTREKKKTKMIPQEHMGKNSKRGH